MVGIYDGHGGYQASQYVASNIGRQCEDMLNLSKEQYDKSKNSVQNNNKAFIRDNPTLSEITPSQNITTSLKI